MATKYSSGDIHEYLFPGSQVLQQPSAVDTALPAIYSRRVLIFKNPSRDHDHSEAIQVLRNAMQTTVKDFPVLSNSVSFSSGVWKFSPGNARLHIKELPLTFEELQNANFSSTLLKPDVLSSVPGMSDFENDWDCCRIQASFIKGGLLISVSILHLAMDGAAITHVIRALARNSCIPARPMQRKSPAAYDRSRLSITSTHTPDIAKMPAYMILNEAFDFASRMLGSISTRMYRFTDQRLAQLKSNERLDIAIGRAMDKNPGRSLRTRLSSKDQGKTCGGHS